MNPQLPTPNSQLPSSNWGIGNWELEIVSGAWTRLRNLLGALDRVDRLDTSSGFDGWLQQLARDETALDATLREFLLRSIRLASDPTNYVLLSQLKQSGTIDVIALLATMRLSRVELVERLNADSPQESCAQVLHVRAGSDLLTKRLGDRPEPFGEQSDQHLALGRQACTFFDARCHCF